MENTLAHADLMPRIWNNITIDAAGSVRGDIDTTFRLTYNISAVRKTTKGKEMVTVTGSVEMTNWQRFDISAQPLSSPAGHAVQLVRVRYASAAATREDAALPWQTHDALALTVLTNTTGTSDPLIVSQLTSVDQSYGMSPALLRVPSSRMLCSAELRARHLCLRLRGPWLQGV